MFSAVEQLLHQPDLVVGVEDGEVGLQPDQLGVAAQDLHADRMEGAEPRHALDDLPDHRADAQLHLARRLVGEGDGEDLRRARLAEARMWAMRVVSTRVLPVPAPASTSTGPSSVSTASRCSGLRPSRYGAAALRARTRRDAAGGGRGSSGELLTRRVCHSDGFRRIC